MRLGTEVTEARQQDDGVLLTLSDGTTREVDHLMFGTGYRVDVARYAFLSPASCRCMPRTATRC